MIVVSEDAIRRNKEAGWWTEVRLTDLLDEQAAQTPDREALVDAPNRERLMSGAPRRLTWAEVSDEAWRFAALLNRAGLKKDDVLLTQLPNIVEYVAIYLAAWRLGIIVTPLPVQHREKEARFAAEKTGAKAILTARNILSRNHLALMRGVKAVSPSVDTLLAFDAGGDDDTVDIDGALARIRDADIVQAREVAESAAMTAHDVATICWTSGTEAVPKGVPRNHNEWRLIAEFQISAVELQPGTRMLVPFPMVNMSGVGSGIVLWLRLGGAMVLHHPFDLDLFLSQLRDEEIDYTVTAPAVLNRLLNEREKLAGIDFRRLAGLGSGSAPLSEWMVRTWRDDYGVDLNNNYGSNEGAGLVSSCLDVPDPAERAVYFPRFGDRRFDWKHIFGQALECRLVDPDTGEEITGPGRPGELLTRGPTVFSGYWEAQELTEAAFDKDGWFRTGDLFEIDGPDDKYFRFVGRCKDIVVRGGMNISCEEVEGYLNAHPAVTEAAIIGAPDPVMGERICACVVAADEPPDKDALNAYLRSEWQIAVYKQIERLEFFDALPRNPIGKVLKRELRDEISRRGDAAA